jgi:hypothetical protein
MNRGSTLGLLRVLLNIGVSATYIQVTDTLSSGRLSVCQMAQIVN